MLNQKIINQAIGDKELQEYVYMRQIKRQHAIDLDDCSSFKEKYFFKK